MWIIFYQNLQNYYFHLNIYSTGAKPQLVRFYPSNSLSKHWRKELTENKWHTQNHAHALETQVSPPEALWCAKDCTHSSRGSWGYLHGVWCLHSRGSHHETRTVTDPFHTQFFPICYRVTEWLGWEGTFKSHLVQALPTPKFLRWAFTLDIHFY